MLRLPSSTTSSRQRPLSSGWTLTRKSVRTCRNRDHCLLLETFQVNLEILLPTSHHIAFEQAQASPLQSRPHCAGPAASRRSMSLCGISPRRLAEAKGRSKSAPQLTTKARPVGAPSSSSSSLATLPGCFSSVAGTSSSGFPLLPYEFVLPDGTGIEVVAVGQPVLSKQRRALSSGS